VSFVLKNFLKVFLSGFLVVVIFCLPTISAIQQIKPSSLFRNVFQACDFYFNKKNISLIILSIIGLILLFALDSQKPLYTVGYFLYFFLFALRFMYYLELLFFI
jgi:putative ABC transport system permease protein